MPILRDKISGIITNALIDSPEEFLQLESLYNLFQKVLDNPTLELSNAEFFSLQKAFSGFRIDHSIGGYSASPQDKSSARNLKEALGVYEIKHPEEIEAARKKRYERAPERKIDREALLRKAKGRVGDISHRAERKNPPKPRPR